MGNGTEYAKIYFVNLALTILTFGIYSAWAKVRNKKYFYGNTIVAGSSFDYHASPIQILKGRFLIVGLFVLYNVVSGMSPIVGMFLFWGFLAVLPWVILKATQFNMRNSSYRQIRFDFKGDVGVMFGLYVILPIAAVFTLWLAYPYVAFKQKHYYVNHTYYGTSPFFFDGTSKEFFFAYYKAFGGLLLIFILIGFLVGFSSKSFTEGFKEGFNKKWEQQTQQKLHAIEPQTPVASIGYPPLKSDTQIKPTPNTTKEKESRITPAVLGIVVLIYGFFFLIFLVVMTYINTRITNYIFNNLKLTYMRFSSKIGYWKLMWIYFTNIILIFLTLGVFIPWAKVRAVKYKLSCMDIYTLDMESHIATESEQVKAVGEEFSDFLDIDVGL